MLMTNTHSNIPYTFKCTLKYGKWLFYVHLLFLPVSPSGFYVQLNVWLYDTYSGFDWGQLFLAESEHNIVV